MRYYFLMFLAAYLFGGAALPHPFHVGRMEANYKPSEKAVQLSVHLFIDDLEAALRKRGHDKLFLGTPREAPEARVVLESYLRETIKFSVNGSQTRWEWVGKETSKDMQALWIHAELKKINILKNMEVTFSTITELYVDQQNLVYLKLPNKKSASMVLSRLSPKGSIKL